MITNHDATGILSYHSVLIFLDNNTIANNSGIFGGGIALYDASEIVSQQRITFLNNHASISGGGIFVSQLIGVDIGTACFFNILTKHPMFYFVNNTAEVSGDVLYGGNIDKCHVKFDHYFHYPTQTGLSVVSSDPIQVCFCESKRPNCSITKISMTGMPGTNVNMPPIATVGIKDGLTEGIIKFTDSSSNEHIYNLSANCNIITYGFKMNSSLNTTQVFITLESIKDNLYDGYDPPAKAIEIIVESCPVGFPLVNSTCVCRSELNTSSIKCDINKQIISRDGDMWIGYQNDSDCLIIYQKCPFDYCNEGTSHFKITSPDPQCLLNRSGVLCGQCAKRLSLILGSNQCGQCTNDYLILIIPFALAGIVLVAFIIGLNLTVSVGTINGLVFYANIVKLYEPIFFPNGPILFLSQFISWINLDLGIETCFYNGMNACHKTWLQFVFPGYVWFLLILITILSRYSSRLVRIVERHVIQVLTTMILLSYTKLIPTVFQAFYYTNIQCSGENSTVTLLRWTIDANVLYLNDYCHLSLFLFSLVVFILLIAPYTFFLLTITLLERPLLKYCKFSMYIKPFFDAYGGPYKDKCRFWTGILLLVRIVLALVVSVDTKGTVSLDVLMCFLNVITSLHIFLRGIYYRFPLNCLEMSFIFNLIFMAYMNTQIMKLSRR